MGNTLNDFNFRASRVKKFVENSLSNSLGMPIKISDETARVIAIFSLHKGGDFNLWLNETQKSAKSLALELKVISADNNTIDLEKKRTTQDVV